MFRLFISVLGFLGVFIFSSTIAYTKAHTWDEYCKLNLRPKNQYHYVGIYLADEFDATKNEDEKLFMIEQAIRLYVRAGIKGQKTDPEVAKFKKDRQQEFPNNGYLESPFGGVKINPTFASAENPRQIDMLKVEEATKAWHTKWDRQVFHAKEKDVLRFFAKAGSLLESRNAWFDNGGPESFRELWAKAAHEKKKNQLVDQIKNHQKNPHAWENILYYVTNIWQQEAQKDPRISERDKFFFQDSKIAAHLWIGIEALMTPMNKNTFMKHGYFVKLPIPYDDITDEISTVYGKDYVVSKKPHQEDRTRLRGTLLFEMAQPNHRGTFIRLILECTADEDLRKMLSEKFDHQYNLSAQADLMWYADWS